MIVKIDTDKVYEALKEGEWPDRESFDRAIANASVTGELFTTSGEKRVTPINKHRVLDIIQVVKAMELVKQNSNKDAIEMLDRLEMEIEGISPVQLPDGKKLVKRYYPRIMVKDTIGGHEYTFRVGDNAHDQLEILRGKKSSRIAYLNLQCMCSTEYEDEGYSFVGEKPYEDMFDETEIVPFDAVWVEEQEEQKN